MATLQLLSSGYLSTLIIILISTAIVFLIFWLLREFWCWYFKINEMKLNQDRIIYLLTKILVQQGGGLDDEDKMNMKY